MLVYEYKSLLEELQNKKIIIYGAGYVAQKFYLKVLVAYGYEKNVECFCISKTTQIYQYINHIPIRNR